MSSPTILAQPNPMTGGEATKTEPLFQWLDRRGAGILLHPTSFPGPGGIGTLSEEATEAWLKFLSDSGCKYWQVCPLGPTGYGDSPYQCFSAFAGNPYLIDLAALQQLGLLSAQDTKDLEALPRDRVDFGALYRAKWPALFKAFSAFKNDPGIKLPYGDFADFQKRNHAWLEPYALFLALKDHHQGKPWWQWPESLRFYSRAIKEKIPSEVKDRAEAHSFFQYIFFGQWGQVRERAVRRKIEIIGDAPIFVARDSADVWSNPELFQIDGTTGQPLFVAGVPPDYFSSDGQLWGNPVYAWKKHAATGFGWWLARLRANFTVCDILRIDHFRAFDSYWSIPADAKSAKSGTWQPGPGIEFFKAVKASVPHAKLIAEDLGELTPSVRLLRDATGLPGMTILQFAFGSGSDNLYLPHNLAANCVVYPGTHDNDTSIGWYRAAPERERDHVRRYLRITGDEIQWDLVRAAYSSVSNLAIIPLQDLLNLGTSARFNTPGKAEGNWQWRYRDEQLADLQKQGAPYLHEIGEMFGRLPESKQVQR